MPNQFPTSASSSVEGSSSCGATTTATAGAHQHSRTTAGNANSSVDPRTWLAAVLWPDVILQESIACYAVNPRATFLATGTHSGHLFLWQLHTLHTYFTTTTSRKSSSHAVAGSSLADSSNRRSPDEKKSASCANNVNTRESAGSSSSTSTLERHFLNSGESVSLSRNGVISNVHLKVDGCNVNNAADKKNDETADHNLDTANSNLDTANHYVDTANHYVENRDHNVDTGDRSVYWSSNHRSELAGSSSVVNHLSTTTKRERGSGVCAVAVESGVLAATTAAPAAPAAVSVAATRAATAAAQAKHVAEAAAEFAATQQKNCSPFGSIFSAAAGAAAAAAAEAEKAAACAAAAAGDLYATTERPKSAAAVGPAEKKKAFQSVSSLFSRLFAEQLKQTTPLPAIPHCVLLSEWGGAASLVDCDFAIAAPLPSSHTPLPLCSGVHQLQQPQRQQQQQQQQQDLHLLLETSLRSSNNRTYSEEVLVSLHADNKLRLWSLRDGCCFSVAKLPLLYPLLAVRVLADRRYVLLYGETGAFVLDLWKGACVVHLALMTSPQSTSCLVSNCVHPHHHQNPTRGTCEDGFSQQQQFSEAYDWPQVRLTAVAVNAAPDCSAQNVLHLQRCFPQLFAPLLNPTKGPLEQHSFQQQLLQKTARPKQCSESHNSQELVCPSTSEKNETALKTADRASVAALQAPPPITSADAYADGIGSAVAAAKTTAKNIPQHFFFGASSSAVEGVCRPPSNRDETAAVAQAVECVGPAMQNKEDFVWPPALVPEVLVAAMTWNGCVAVWSLTDVLRAWERCCCSTSQLFLQQQLLLAPHTKNSEAALTLGECTQAGIAGQSPSPSRIGGGVLYGQREFTVYSSLCKSLVTAHSTLSHKLQRNSDAAPTKGAFDQFQPQRQPRSSLSDDDLSSSSSACGDAVVRETAPSPSELWKRDRRRGAVFANTNTTTAAAVAAPFDFGKVPETHCEDIFEENDQLALDSSSHGLQPVFLSEPYCCCSSQEEVLEQEVGGSGSSSLIAITSSYVIALTPQRLLLFSRRPAPVLLVSGTAAAAFVEYERFLDLYVGPSPSFSQQPFTPSTRTSALSCAAGSSTNQSRHAADFPLFHTQAEKKTPQGTPHQQLHATKSINRLPPPAASEASFLSSTITKKSTTAAAAAECWAGLQVMPLNTHMLPFWELLLNSSSSSSCGITTGGDATTQCFEQSSPPVLPPLHLQHNNTQQEGHQKQEEKREVFSETGKKNKRLFLLSTFESAETVLLAWTTTGSLYAYPLSLYPPMDVSPSFFYLQQQSRCSLQMKSPQLASAAAPKTTFQNCGGKAPPAVFPQQHQKQLWGGGGTTMTTGCYIGQIPEALLGGEDTPTPLLLPLLLQQQQTHQTHYNSTQASSSSKNPQHLENQSVSYKSATTASGLLCLGISVETADRFVALCWSAHDENTDDDEANSSESPLQQQQQQHSPLQSQLDEEQRQLSLLTQCGRDSVAFRFFPSSSTHVLFDCSKSRFFFHNQRPRVFRSACSSSISLNALWRLPSILRPSALQRALDPSLLPAASSSLMMQPPRPHKNKNSSSPAVKKDVDFSHKNSSRSSTPDSRKSSSSHFFSFSPEDASFFSTQTSHSFKGQSKVQTFPLLLPERILSRLFSPFSHSKQLMGLSPLPLLLQRQLLQQQALCDFPHLPLAASASPSLPKKTTKTTHAFRLSSVHDALGASSQLSHMIGPSSQLLHDASSSRQPLHASSSLPLHDASSSSPQPLHASSSSRQPLHASSLPLHDASSSHQPLHASASSQPLHDASSSSRQPLHASSLPLHASSSSQPLHASSSLPLHDASSSRQPLHASSSSLPLHDASFSRQPLHAMGGNCQSLHASRLFSGALMDDLVANLWAEGLLSGEGAEVHALCWCLVETVGGKLYLICSMSDGEVVAVGLNNEANKKRKRLLHALPNLSKLSREEVSTTALSAVVSTTSRNNRNDGNASFSRKLLLSKKNNEKSEGEGIIKDNEEKHQRKPRVRKTAEEVAMKKQLHTEDNETHQQQFKQLQSQCQKPPQEKNLFVESGINSTFFKQQSGEESAKKTNSVEVVVQAAKSATKIAIEETKQHKEDGDGKGRGRWGEGEEGKGGEGGEGEGGERGVCDEEIDDEEKTAKTEKVLYLCGHPTLVPWPSARRLSSNLLQLPTPATHPLFAAAADHLSSNFQEDQWLKKRRRRRRRRTTITRTSNNSSCSNSNSSVNFSMEKGRCSRSTCSSSSSTSSTSSTSNSEADSDSNSNSSSSSSSSTSSSSSPRAACSEEAPHFAVLSDAGAADCSRNHLIINTSTSFHSSDCLLHNVNETAENLCTKNRARKNSSTNNGSRLTAATVCAKDCSAVRKKTEKKKSNEKKNGSVSTTPQKKKKPCECCCCSSDCCDNNCWSEKTDRRRLPLYAEPESQVCTQITCLLPLSSLLVAAGTNRGDLLLWQLPFFSVCCFLPQVLQGPASALLRVLSVCGGEGEVHFDSNCFLAVDASDLLSLVDAAKCCGCSDTCGALPPPPHAVVAAAARKTAGLSAMKKHLQQPPSQSHLHLRAAPRNNRNPLQPVQKKMETKEEAGPFQQTCCYYGGGQPQQQLLLEHRHLQQQQLQQHYLSSSGGGGGRAEELSTAAQQVMMSDFGSTRGLVESPLYVHFRSSNWGVRTPQLLRFAPRPANWGGVFPLERHHTVSGALCSLRRVVLDVLSDLVCCFTATHCLLWKLQSGRLLHAASLSVVCRSVMNSFCRRTRDHTVASERSSERQSKFAGKSLKDVSQHREVTTTETDTSLGSTCKRLFLQNPNIFTASPHLELTSRGLAIGHMQLLAASCCRCCYSVHSSTTATRQALLHSLPPPESKILRQVTNTSSAAAAEEIEDATTDVFFEEEFVQDHSVRTREAGNCANCAAAPPTAIAASTTAFLLKSGSDAQTQSLFRRPQKKTCCGCDKGGQIIERTDPAIFCCSSNRDIDRSLTLATCPVVLLPLEFSFLPREADFSTAPAASAATNTTHHTQNACNNSSSGCLSRGGGSKDRSSNLSSALTTVLLRNYSLFYPSGMQSQVDTAVQQAFPLFLKTSSLPFFVPAVVGAELSLSISLPLLLLHGLLLDLGLQQHVAVATAATAVVAVGATEKNIKKHFEEKEEAAVVASHHPPQSMDACVFALAVATALLKKCFLNNEEELYTKNPDTELLREVFCHQPLLLLRQQLLRLLQQLQKSFEEAVVALGGCSTESDNPLNEMSLEHFEKKHLFFDDFFAVDSVVCAAAAAADTAALQTSTTVLKAAAIYATNSAFNDAVTPFLEQIHQLQLQQIQQSAKKETEKMQQQSPRRSFKDRNSPATALLMQLQQRLLFGVKPLPTLAQSTQTLRTLLLYAPGILRFFPTKTISTLSKQWQQGKKKELLEPFFLQNRQQQIHQHTKPHEFSCDFKNSSSCCGSSSRSSSQKLMLIEALDLQGLPSLFSPVHAALKSRNNISNTTRATAAVACCFLSTEKRHCCCCCDVCRKKKSFPTGGSISSLLLRHRKNCCFSESTTGALSHAATTAAVFTGHTRTYHQYCSSSSAETSLFFFQNFAAIVVDPSSNNRSSSHSSAAFSLASLSPSAATAAAVSAAACMWSCLEAFEAAAAVTSPHKTACVHFQEQQQHQQLPEKFQKPFSQSALSEKSLQKKSRLSPSVYSSTTACGQPKKSLTSTSSSPSPQQLMEDEGLLLILCGAKNINNRGNFLCQNHSHHHQPRFFRIGDDCCCCWDQKTERCVWLSAKNRRVRNRSVFSGHNLKKNTTKNIHGGSFCLQWKQQEENKGEGISAPSTTDRKLLFVPHDSSSKKSAKKASTTNATDGGAAADSQTNTLFSSYSSQQRRLDDSSSSATEFSSTSSSGDSWWGYKAADLHHHHYHHHLTAFSIANYLRLSAATLCSPQNACTIALSFISVLGCAALGLSAAKMGANANSIEGEDDSHRRPRHGNCCCSISAKTAAELAGFAQAALDLFLLNLLPQPSHPIISEEKERFSFHFQQQKQQLPPHTQPNKQLCLLSGNAYLLQQQHSEQSFSQALERNTKRPFFLHCDNTNEQFLLLSLLQKKQQLQQQQPTEQNTQANQLLLLDLELLELQKQVQEKDFFRSADSCFCCCCKANNNSGPMKVWPSLWLLTQWLLRRAEEAYLHRGSSTSQRTLDCSSCMSTQKTTDFEKKCRSPPSAQFFLNLASFEQLGLFQLLRRVLCCMPEHLLLQYIDAALLLLLLRGNTCSHSGNKSSSSSSSFPSQTTSACRGNGDEDQRVVAMSAEAATTAAATAEAAAAAARARRGDPVFWPSKLFELESTNDNHREKMTFAFSTTFHEEQRRLLQKNRTKHATGVAATAPAKATQAPSQNSSHLTQFRFPETPLTTTTPDAPFSGAAEGACDKTALTLLALILYERPSLSHIGGLDIAAAVGQRLACLFLTAAAPAAAAIAATASKSAASTMQSNTSAEASTAETNGFAHVCLELFTLGYGILWDSSCLFTAEIAYLLAERCLPSAFSERLSAASPHEDGSLEPDESFVCELLAVIFAMRCSREWNVCSEILLSRMTRAHAPLFVYVMGKAARASELRPEVSSAALTSLLRFSTNVPEKAVDLLPEIVEAVIRCLDPAEPHLRRRLLPAATAALFGLVRRYPMARFHQQSQRFACAARIHCLIFLFDLRSAAKCKVLEGHAGPVSCLAFSEDGGAIASYSAMDGTLRLWQCSSSGFLGGILGISGKSQKVVQLPRCAPNILWQSTIYQLDMLRMSPKSKTEWIIRREDGKSCIVYVP